jgi:hypothetical protein
MKEFGGSGVNRTLASFGQENGPEVELIVDGTELYATYETKDGLPVVYDKDRGLFCYAKVVHGEYQSTGIPITSPAPADVEPHATESRDVRERKIAERRSAMAARSHLANEKE